jgi:hypothetical protein
MQDLASTDADGDGVSEVFRLLSDGTEEVTVSSSRGPSSATYSPKPLLRHETTRSSCLFNGHFCEAGRGSLHRPFRGVLFLRRRESRRRVLGSGIVDGIDR